MPRKQTIYCNNRSVGRLLADAKSGTLSEPEREAERRVFCDEHLDECRACRDEMMDHANQVALNEIAERSGLGVEGVVEQLGETARQLRDFARNRDASFEEVVTGILRGRLHVGNSRLISEVSSVASTET